MNIKYWLLAVYLLTDSISVVAASFPSLVPVLPSVVVRSGHNATLVCMGQNIVRWNSFLVWKLNGTEIKEGENKKVSKKFFSGRKVNLTLLITNVKEKDVGEYSCEAFIGNFDSADHCKAVIELTMYRKVVAASFPSLVPVLPSVVVRSGHNATLVCMGKNIESWDSFLVWKFNGREIKAGENKKVSQKFFPGRKVNLTLLITNVKEKDVGEYTCEAFIGNFDSTDRCKAVIELKMYRKAKWPKGTYALPMAKTGCPGSHGFSWSEGSLRQDTEDTRPQNMWSQPLHLNGEMKKDAIWQQFCVKENELGDDDWPQGNYCIYKKKTCPAGFSEGWIKWDDEDTKNENSVSGVLPDGTFNEDTTVYFCCRSDGSAHSPISLPRSQPFFLFKHSGRCQAVMGMRAREEWMFWDCEDLKNTNRHFGTIPAALITKDIKVFYCYYSKK